MKWTSFHTNFRFNSRDFSSTRELIDYTAAFDTKIADFLKDWFSDKDMIKVTTSGSTGTPKPIALKKEHVMNSAKATGKYLGLKANSKALLCLPIEYIAGKLMLVRALVLGWDLTAVAPSSNPLESINETYDFTALVPLQLQNSLDKIHYFKTIIVGGAPVSKALEQKLQDVQTKVYATYGMTETITHIAMKPLNHYTYTPTFFKTLDDVRIYKDQRGCLVIHAPKVSDDVIFTNDMVNLISEDAFEWLGRYDHVINSGGVKLHPEQIEAKLAPFISSRFFVSGIQDAVLGEKLILVIEGTLQNIDLSQCDLSKFEVPKEVVFIRSFVETSSGKIQRQKTLALLDLA